MYICTMKGLVIAVKDNDEFKFLTNLLEKLGVSSATVSDEEIEDIGLSRLLQSVDRKKKMSRESIMAKLQA